MGPHIEQCLSCVYIHVKSHFDCPPCPFLVCIAVQLKIVQAKGVKLSGGLVTKRPVTKLRPLCTASKRQECALTSATL